MTIKEYKIIIEKLKLSTSQVDILNNFLEKAIDRYAEKALNDGTSQSYYWRVLGISDGLNFARAFINKTLDTSEYFENDGDFDEHYVEKEKFDI